MNGIIEQFCSHLHCFMYFLCKKDDNNRFSHLMTPVTWLFLHPIRLLFPLELEKSINNDLGPYLGQYLMYQLWSWEGPRMWRCKVNVNLCHRQVLNLAHRSSDYTKTRNHSFRKGSKLWLHVSDGQPLGVNPRPSAIVPWEIRVRH